MSLELRTELRPGDIGAITRRHGELYAMEYGWDERFEAYVAEGLGRWALQRNAVRDRIWIAESEDGIAGSIAIVGAGPAEAQLRWFFVEPSRRGAGLGKQLLTAAMEFCQSAGYSRVFLLTIRDLTAAAHLYRSFGFELTESETHEVWGRLLTEERYDRVFLP